MPSWQEQRLADASLHTYVTRCEQAAVAQAQIDVAALQVELAHAQRVIASLQAKLAEQATPKRGKA